MTTTRDPVFVPGVWGPYRSAMVPGMWLNEGGQSAAGAAIDRLLALHPASSEAAEAAVAAGLSLPVWLARCAADTVRVGRMSDVVRLADGLHVVPEFIGNRAPHADPEARAIISGLDMDQGLKSLVALYIAGLCGLGYGLRQIIETQAEHGAEVRRIVISGGAGQSDLVRQILADATGKAVLSVACDEPVLLGSAILGAVAARIFDDVPGAMRAMTVSGMVFEPGDTLVRKIHNYRFDSFRRLQSVARDIRSRQPRSASK